MDSVFVPLLAKKLYQSGDGRHLAEFSREEALTQIELLQAALGEVKETPKPSFVKPVSMIFYENGDVIYEGHKRFHLSELRHALLQLLYESAEWYVSFQTAMKKIWGNSVVDEDVIKKTIRRLNHDLKIHHIPLELHQQNGFFICLQLSPKCPQSVP